MESSSIEQIDKVIEKLFFSIPVSLIVSGKEFPVQVITRKTQGLIVRLPVQIESSERQLSLVHNDNNFILDFQCLGRDATGLEILRPLKMQIIAASRIRERMLISAKPDLSLSISNIVSQAEVYKGLGFGDKKLDAAIQTNLQKLKKNFPNSNIYIAERADARLRMISNYDRPIFIPDRSDPDSVTGDFFPFNEYSQLMKQNSLQEKIISEICIPIKYRGYVPIGYVQVLSEERLDGNAFNTVNITAVSLKREISQSGIFQESKEICEVGDISNQGLGFFHSQTRIMSRSFVLDATLVFDMMFSGESKPVTYRAVIKSIKPTEKQFRIGCQFHLTPAEEQKILEKFLASKSE
ncbi:MAG: DUF1577 domain-containing protein [Leptospira sp.]|nr:DUF1577 domain-containing protein [Leptospira sp.]